MARAEDARSMMDGRPRARGVVSPRPGSPLLAAAACYAIAMLAASVIMVLVLVRHPHVASNGAGYWTDAFGWRAGVDNVGLGTIVSIFLNWHLHWEHNLAVLGTAVVCLTGLARGRSYRVASRGTASRR
ncbi:MAG: hypothetical protein ABI317_15750 [Gaiellales bacterium]